MIDSYGTKWNGEDFSVNKKQLFMVYCRHASNMR